MLVVVGIVAAAAVAGGVLLTGRSERVAQGIADDAVPGGLRILRIDDPVGDAPRTALAGLVDDPDAALRFEIDRDCDTDCLRRIAERTDEARAAAAVVRELGAGPCGPALGGVTGVSWEERGRPVPLDLASRVRIVLTVLADVESDAGADLFPLLDRCAAALVTDRHEVDLRVSVVPASARPAEPVDPGLPAVLRSAEQADALDAEVRHVARVLASTDGIELPADREFGPALTDDLRDTLEPVLDRAVRDHVVAGTGAALERGPSLRSAVYLPGSVDRLRAYLSFTPPDATERTTRIAAVDVGRDGTDPVVARLFDGSRFGAPYEPGLRTPAG
ncbi:hypothetical protein C8E95_2647 [Pseudonocardia autotrophica]|uniref:Uncharacterized protein n=1 Tax=Pseudonocardia autotrophica TaxID=2074 RepID=A0A1Y2N8F7_PSEAH|nr:hypothetical protein BG845_00402 [Pseudonocardia autotrophica]TDN73546.1 hypothetical protein C8E95_2647 [Pseudonocardia autotrophica]